jgi:hypothetical protein
MEYGEETRIGLDGPGEISMKSNYWKNRREWDYPVEKLLDCQETDFNEIHDSGKQEIARKIRSSSQPDEYVNIGIGFQ